ncbi:hypothetical protein HZZ00_34995 [Streptomyces sp. NEAU-sy36]|uniref:hypothetical protein n=1 Tax=unclassified Streptomyces TaxID=2593676 RepID=UPI0015D6313B|nr:MULTISPECIES: hypothetical protein [unclassified Streptomyces]QLJ05718.1 hypothetical protein HZZ00_34995 [Streptomyces sp. NEAU-sy36]
MTIASPDDIRAELDRTAERIRSRRDLTPQAKQVALARAYQAAQDKMGRLQQDATERYQRDRAKLERQLFGAPDSFGADAVNQRQAREMAAQLTDPKQAANAYQRAVRDGDKAYARAIASHAADHANLPLIGKEWQQVVQQYTQDSPARAEAYQQLAGMRQPGTGVDWTYIVPSPPELGRYTSTQVQVLAQTDLEVHGNEPSSAA